MNFAGIGPMSRRAVAGLEEHIAMLTVGDDSCIELLLDAWQHAKELGAELLGIDADHVTFPSSTSHGLFSTAFGLSGGNAVVPANEFPANLYPWIRAEQMGRFELRRVPVPDGRVTVDCLRAAVDRDTVAVAVSAVGYTTGYRADLAALREMAGEALLVVDAVQALGALGVDMSHADVVTAGSQKWMRAGIGSAIIGVSDRMLERYQPALTGWTGVEEMFGPAPAPHEPLPSAERLAMGSPPLMAVGAWRGALSLTLEAGIANIERSVLTRAEAFRDALAGTGVEFVLPDPDRSELSSILSFTTPGHDIADVAASLDAEGFVLTYRPEEGVIRVSPHATTPLESADDLGEALRKLLN